MAMQWHVNIGPTTVTVQHWCSILQHAALKLLRLYDGIRGFVGVSSSVSRGQIVSNSATTPGVLNELPSDCCTGPQVKIKETCFKFLPLRLVQRLFAFFRVLYRSWTHDSLLHAWMSPQISHLFAFLLSLCAIALILPHSLAIPIPAQGSEPTMFISFNPARSPKNETTCCYMVGK